LIKLISAYTIFPHMRLSVATSIVGLALAVVGFAASWAMRGPLLGVSVFSIGILLNILGLIMMRRDMEAIMLRYELEGKKPSPEDIKKRPLRRPRKP
jgi:sulfite exporter TauE/SafE